MGERSRSWGVELGWSQKGLEWPGQEGMNPQGSSRGPARGAVRKCQIYAWLSGRKEKKEGKSHVRSPARDVCGRGVTEGGIWGAEVQQSLLQGKQGPFRKLGSGTSSLEVPGAKQVAEGKQQSYPRRWRGCRVPLSLREPRKPGAPGEPWWGLVR